MKEGGWLWGCRQGTALRNGEAAGGCQGLSRHPHSPACVDGQSQGDPAPGQVTWEQVGQKHQVWHG